MSKKKDHNASASSDNQAYTAVEPSLSKSATTAIGSKASISLSRRESTNKQILHVEPNEDCRFLVRTLLRLEGYLVTSVCTAEQAREIIRSNAFGAYILDNSPFDQCGIELCRYICRLNIEALVIFYSGAAYPFNIEHGLNAGAKEYLTKPCGIEILTDTVARLIHSQALYSQNVW